MRYQTYLAVGSIALSFLSLIFGRLLLEVFGIAETNPAFRHQVSMLIAFFFLLASGLFSILSVVSNSNAKLHALISGNQQSVKKQLDAFGISFGMLRHHPGIDGIELVADKLSTVSRVRNTRIVPEEYKGDIYAAGAAHWDEDIIKAVKGGVVFFDVVSGKGIESGKSNLEALKHGPRPDGKYTLAIVSPKLDSFINFKILDFKDQSQEVWFGWRLSVTSTIDEPCFRSGDRKLIALFERFHEDLLNSADSTEIVPD